MAEPEESADETVESIEQLRKSFKYGSRSNMDAKFFADLSDAEFGDFLEELMAGMSDTVNTGAAGGLIDTMFRWQVQATRGHVDPNDFRYRYDDIPLATLVKPLAESRVALLTSSGHFVAGDDPRPLGVDDMSQAEAEARIKEFVREAPTLSAIPIDTPAERLRVRHGGYAVASAMIDPQVNFPIGHLRDLADDGVIGELSPMAYSFPGASAQGRIRKESGPAWAQQLVDEHVDAVLLVPV